MTKKKSKPTRYKIWMRPVVHTTRKQLPGYVRLRIKRILDDLGQNPRPPKSRALRLPDSAPPEWEVRRIRLENWRIVYAINETWHEIGILTIQKRPPYDYEDLELLLSEL